MDMDLADVDGMLLTETHTVGTRELGGMMSLAERVVARKSLLAMVDFVLAVDQASSDINNVVERS